MSLNWNTTEGQRLFQDYRVGGDVVEFADLVVPGQIHELTIAAGGFLRRRNRLLHSFSGGAVRYVRGPTTLSAVTLALDPHEGTHTFTRTYEARDMRELLGDAADEAWNEDDDWEPGLPSIDEANPSFQDVPLGIGWDLRVRQDTFFKDAYVPERSNVMHADLDGSTEPDVITGDFMPQLVTEDVMVMRWLLHAESQRRTR